MFFKGYLAFIFLKFLWAGLLLGIVKPFLYILNKFTRNNVYVFNLISFIFWTAFSAIFIYLCYAFYDASFCWFGLVGMFVGLLFVKVSFDFLLTKLLLLLYHSATKLRLRKKLK